MTSSRLPRSYWRLWWAGAVDNVGDGAFAAAVPLLAVSVTRDARLVAALSAAMYLPWLLCSLPVGALVDRTDRVRLMWASQTAQAVLAAMIAVLAATGHASIGMLAVLAFALGVGEVVFGNAAQAFLPDLVSAEQLAAANGRQYAMTTVGQMFVGPPLGSFLFAAAVGLPFGVDAATFAASAALLATLPRRPVEPHDRVPLWQAVGDGLRWLAGHRVLRTLAVLLGVNNFCNQLANATLVLLATRTMHVGVRGYGVLLAGAALGAVLGGLFNDRIAVRFGMLPSLIGALAANVALYLAVGLTTDPVVLGVLLAGSGYVTTLWNIVTVSLRQQIVPRELLGRVNSIYRMLGWGLIPLGAVTGGFVAHEFGLRAPYPVAGVLRGIALLAALPALVLALRRPLGAREREGAA